MIFSTFWTQLKTIEEAITITSPVSLKVKKAYWGAPALALPDHPAIFNTLTEPDRILNFGSRDQRMSIDIQLLVNVAPSEVERTSEIATAFWFAAKDAFDKNTTINSTVSFSTLRGGNPTVPVILTHAGIAYIGFSGTLDIHDARKFTF